MDRPYVISWNLTYRCNLACDHCYLDAGAPAVQKRTDDAFSDRRELSTEECVRVIKQIATHAPESLTILTGGEPLLRRDIVQLIECASEHKLWVVVGTNGVRVTARLAEILKKAGMRGMALSLDSLQADRHDTFRGVKGAWENTVEGARILTETEVPFIVQTTVGSHNSNDLERIAAFAFRELKAKVWNLYFLVQTGRGAYVSDISGEEYAEVLATLSRLQQAYTGKMVVNAKCAPHYMQYLFEHEPDSPFLKSYTEGAGGCPAGTHYLGIRPNGEVTPCPYLPVFGGNLREETLASLWSNSEVFVKIRNRSALGGRCGTCEFQGACGGCRARAYGVTEDFMAEDMLCRYEPGSYQREEVDARFERGVKYGVETEQTIVWDDAAKERIDRVPRFVRGMVMKSVESYCSRNGISVVTTEELEAIRKRMPTRKVF